MAKAEIAGVRIAGMASAVPIQARGLESLEFIDPEQALIISANVGVKTRRIAPSSVCTSDLCYAAAARLMRELDWAPGEIAGLIFITQTPDYPLPATSHVLQARLGLPTSCYVFDINLGCSGFVYGLWIAASLMQNVKGKTLLLVGDAISHIISNQDQSVAPLFGDAGTATALEPSADAAPMFFELGADGSGAKNLMIPAGGRRRPRDASTGVRTLREGQNIRSDDDLLLPRFYCSPALDVAWARRVLKRAAIRHAWRGGCCRFWVSQPFPPLQPRIPRRIVSGPGSPSTPLR